MNLTSKWNKDCSFQNHGDDCLATLLELTCMVRLSSGCFLKTFYDARVCSWSSGEVVQLSDVLKHVFAADCLCAFDHYFALIDLSEFVIEALRLFVRHRILLLSSKLLAKLLK